MIIGHYYSQQSSLLLYIASSSSWDLFLPDPNGPFSYAYSASKITSSFEIYLVDLEDRISALLSSYIPCVYTSSLDLAIYSICFLTRCILWALGKVTARGMPGSLKVNFNLMKEGSCRASVRTCLRSPIRKRTRISMLQVLLPIKYYTLTLWYVS